MADARDRDTPAGDGVNEAFHAAYGAAQGARALDAPVFVLLSESLVVHHRGARSEHGVRPRAFHVIKAVSHAPVGLFALLDRGARAEELAGFAARIAQAHAELAREQGALPDAPLLDAVLADTARFVAELGTGRAATRSLAEFAARMGPRLSALAGSATRLQLSALHAVVERVVAPFTAEERAALQVVVTGDHQARELCLGLQYFQKRLGEPPRCEERVTYAEAVADEACALALVGTRKLDRKLAQAFFGDPRRLQRDVLGDAAAALLADMELAPIGPCFTRGAPRG